ncbi:hypothetical protein KKF25_01150 [Patescibacteria group bacterium]|nr:hypothetical protein [Patescibacteria group bacterium]
MSLRAPSEAEGRGNPVDSGNSSGLRSLSREERGIRARYAPRNDKFGFFKKLIFLFVIGSLSFVIYSYNLKPFLAVYRGHQILSLPVAQAQAAASLLKDALALNSFASPEIAYQAAIEYTEKINQNPALAQNEEFYNIAASELSKIIERSPNRARNYIALAWLNLYFSNQHPDRINESISLAGQIIELSPTKKDAYLILAAGYALSNQPLPAQEIILRASAIDGKMGEEVRGYYGKLK